MTHAGRRSFLKTMTAAGSSLALQGIARHAMGATLGQVPRRFIAWTTPCGHPPEEFWPSGNAGPATGWELKRILKPLEPWKSKLILADQLNIRYDGGRPGDQHQQGTGKLLTGANLLPGSSGGAGISPGWSTAASLDVLIAKALGSKAINVGVQVTRHNTWSRYSHLGPNQPNTPIGSPAELHRMLFSESSVATPGPTMPMPAAMPASPRKASIDFLLGDAKRLRDRLGTEERAKLDEQVDYLNERAKRLDAPMVGASGCTKPATPMTINAMDNSQHGVVGRLLIDGVVAAMRCDMARTATIQWSQSISDTNFSWLLQGQTVHHHSLTHRFNGTGGQSSATLAPMAQELFVRASTWYAEQFRYLLEELDKVKEGDGTMLDNTIIFWGGDTNGFAHSHGRMQFLLAGGGGGGRVRTGRWVNFLRNHNDLLTGIAHATGVPMDTIGEKDYCKGPIDLAA